MGYSKQAVVPVMVPALEHECKSVVAVAVAVRLREPELVQEQAQDMVGVAMGVEHTLKTVVNFLVKDFNNTITYVLEVAVKVYEVGDRLVVEVVHKDYGVVAITTKTCINLRNCKRKKQQLTGMQ